MIDHMIRGRTETTSIYCRLTPLGLEVQGTGRRPTLIPYETIREVNLQSIGMPGGTARYRCGIRSWEHSRLQVDNVGFRGQHDADSGDGAYRHFITRLHRILKQQGVSCRFTRGSAGLAFAGWCLLGVLLLGSAASLWSLGLKGLWLVGCMLPAAPYGAYLIHNSRCEDYAPDELPKELLPEIEPKAERAAVDMNSRRRAEVAC